MNIFIVTKEVAYEGIDSQWVYLDEAEARAQFDSIVSHGFPEDVSVVLRGPFEVGEDMGFNRKLLAGA